MEREEEEEGEEGDLAAGVFITKVTVAKAEGVTGEWQRNETEADADERVRNMP
jgi:hypothetical protein